MFLEVRGLGKSYTVGATSLTVLRDLDLAVAEGEMVAVVGASGVGKSTLLHVIGGLDRADAGTVTIGDTELTQLQDQGLVAFRNKQVGFVFQFHHLLPEFNAIENVAMPVRIARLPASQAYSRADELLRRVGLSERLTHRPGMLSGGGPQRGGVPRARPRGAEHRRVAVPRALLMHPAVLLPAEPTGDLDEQTAESLHALLRDMHASYHLTSIIATHNSRLAAACDRVLRLHEGRLVAA